MVHRIVKPFLRKITRRQLIIGSAVLGVVLLGGIVAFTVVYHKRETLLETTLDKVKTRLADDYQIDLAIGNAYFSGLTTITLEDVTVTPQHRDPIAQVNSASVRVRLLPLVTGDVKFGYLRADSTHIQLIKEDRISNYDFLFREPDPEQQEAPTEKTDAPAINMAEAANRMLNNILYKIPKNMKLRGFLLT